MNGFQDVECLGCKTPNRIPMDARKFNCYECLGINQWNDDGIALTFTPNVKLRVVDEVPGGDDQQEHAYSLTDGHVSYGDGASAESSPYSYFDTNFKIEADVNFALPDVGAIRNGGDNRTRVPDIMADAAETFRQRNALYGNSYMDFYRVGQALFPEGVQIETEEEWNRFGVLMMIMGKIHRYAKNFKQGGHRDSAHDLGVYSFMLEDLTRGN